MNISNPKHAKVIEAYLRGDSLEQIAIQNGYARSSSISEIAGKYGVPLRGKTPEGEARRKSVFALYDKGMALCDIARTLDLSQSTVWSIVRRKKWGQEPPSDVRVKTWSASRAAVEKALQKAGRA